MIGNLFTFVVYAAVGIAVLMVWFEQDRDRERQARVHRGSGIELEAEILARYEARALQGSELAKARQVYMAPWDPRELELRYTFDGREIVSRNRVSAEIFFHTRGVKTLKIKILPNRPEDWVALA
jgi:hypothetical protein